MSVTMNELRVNIPETVTASRRMRSILSTKLRILWKVMRRGRRARSGNGRELKGQADEAEGRSPVASEKGGREKGKELMDWA